MSFLQVFISIWYNLVARGFTQLAKFFVGVGILFNDIGSFWLKCARYYVGAVEKMLEENSKKDSE